MALAWVFWSLLAALAVERLFELRLARAHERALAARGGRRVPGDFYAPIVAMHVAFFLACATEFVVSPRARVSAWTLAFLPIFLVGQGLRYWSMRTLGDRWTTRVWIVPGERRVLSGPYRFTSHPIYVGVALELFAFPLAFSLVWTAALASVVNAIVLVARIRREEAALALAEAPA